MAYVAARGGEQAIQQAEKLFQDLKGELTLELVEQIEQTMPYLLDRVMGEASLYAPKLAALAIAQTGGELYEAVMLLRAYRSTQPRLAYAAPVDSRTTLTVRRISAAFKDIPDGQMLGPTLDYSHRLLRTDILDGRPVPEPDLELADQPAPRTYTPVADWQRSTGLVEPLPEQAPVEPANIPDLTREPLLFPPPRAQRLQSLARAETGGVLALGYSTMRGYGLVHPTVNEVRLGYAEVNMKHPLTGEPFSLGRVRVSHCEIVSNTMKQNNNGQPRLELGFAATLGWNEVKTIAASMLDMGMDKPARHPAHSEEFVLYHTEPVESSGFCIHYKLPHYVTFNSSLDAMREVRKLYGMFKPEPSPNGHHAPPAAEAPATNDERQTTQNEDHY
ncbi:MAG: carbon-phosphorus lyase complex subunit PhnI [Chloroflexales bacterium]|nr:carbon-phosphorus lyase complex subunit PhnI [Chloroflexales bacterium]